MPIEKPIAKRYYPALSEVITVDDLPEFLHFAEDGLNQLLSRIHYKNLQYSKSQRGDAAFYSLDIVTANIGLNLPFGMRLVINPDEDGDSSISSFPVSLQYQWEMLAFLRSFKVQNFAFSTEAFYDLGLKIFKITEDEVVAHILNYFIEDDETVSKFAQLVEAVNIAYPNANIALPIGEEPTVNVVVALINQNVNIPKSASGAMFAVYVLDSDPEIAKARLQQFYNKVVPNGIEDYIKQLITPKIRATLKLSAGIEFPRNILKPVNEFGVPYEDPEVKSLFKFLDATFYVDTESGIGSEIAFSGNLYPEYSEIGNTGIIIQIQEAKLDLSRNKNIPEADAAGYTPDFMGLYVKRLSIGFTRFGKQTPGKTSVALTAENLLIGTGGVSGRIGLESNGALYYDFGDFATELNQFSLTFNRGVIVESDIAGKLFINGFHHSGVPAVIDVRAHIRDNGDFDITAMPHSGLYTISLPNVFDFGVRSLSLGRQAKGYYVEVAGILDFTADIPGLGKVLPTGIDIEKMRIWDNGDIDFEGGNFTIPKTFKLKVGPVNLEVSNVSFGAYPGMVNGIERRYRFFGFDGMINIGTAGVKANGNGIKYYFTVDNNDTDKPFDSFTSIDGIGIDMIIPGNATKDEAAFILNGYLRMSNPDPAIIGSATGTEYTGAISFSLPKLGLEGSAAMRLKPSIPAFVVDIGLELPGPIPLGATGLGIYGFRGLIGQHYKASKSATTPPLPEDATWWEYYKAKSTITGQEGIELDKFADKPGYSVGAGASIATVFDKGITFSSKLFIYLGLPGVFLLQGQAGVLRRRIGLNEDVDPPFSALIAIDNKSFMANLSVNYRLPEGGAYDGFLFSLKGVLETAFFFNNASGWYLNVGKDQPESKRIQSKILTLFQGYAYLMVSSRGIKAGAGARFDFNRNFGIIRMGVGAFLDVAGSISFKPIQIAGHIQLGGYAYFEVLRIRLSISIVVTLGFEAPHPFSIYGSLEINLGLPWPIRKLGKIFIELRWTINGDRQPLLDAIPVLRLPESAEGYMPAAATNILSGETFPINFVKSEIIGNSFSIPNPGDGVWKHPFNNELHAMQVTIPLDSFIDIDLLKPVKPGQTKIGGAGNQLPDGYVELLPPQRGLTDQVRHEFQLVGIEVNAWDTSSNTWKPYNIYEAVTAIVNENTGAGAIDLGSLNNGYWQFSEPNRYNKIRLLSQNMFSFSNDLTKASSDLDAFNFQRKDLFCYEQVTKKNIVNWASEPLNSQYNADVPFYIQELNFMFKGISGSVKEDAGYGNHTLHVEESNGGLTIFLPYPVTYFKLDFGVNNNDIRVDFINYSYRFLPFGLLSPKDIALTTVNIDKATQNASAVYDNLSQPIQKVYVGIKSNKLLDFEGDLLIGGHFELPESYITAGTDFPAKHAIEMDKALMYASLFNRSFTESEVLNESYSSSLAIAQWPMNSALAQIGDNHLVLGGSPDLTNGFYKTVSGELQLQQVYQYTANADVAMVPFVPELKIETDSFAFETTAIFNPFEAGISTLLSKVALDPLTGDKKGYALHLYQDTPGVKGNSYNAEANIPSFGIWLTTYSGTAHTGIKITDKYIVDCATAELQDVQYKHIFVSVNRSTGKIDIFIDRVKKVSADIPSTLNLVVQPQALTSLNQITYLSESLQRRQEENDITPAGLISESQILSDNLNKTVQPVWRPNTIFAVVLKTRDVVDGDVTGSVIKNHIYGFRTAGPIGHFQQKSAIYQLLVAEDRASEFKLAGLKYYIDYERSFPDAQGRYDLSKPVFCHDPKLALLFIKPYINAMFTNWDTYLGMPGIQSSLALQLLDPHGVIMEPQLIWEQLPDQAINDSNYKKLPKDQQILYLMNKAALEDSCNVNPITITKKKKQGSFHFDDLEPNRLYTAIFTAIYQPSGEQVQRSEVHRFTFITSRYASFQKQAESYVLDETAGSEKFALYALPVSFTATEINDVLKKLIDDNPDNDDVSVAHYAVKYERLVYGGLRLKNLESISGTAINLVINIDPDTAEQRILGVLIRNPEQFNNPKLSEAQLIGTVKLRLTKIDTTVIEPNSFVYIHSKDSSAVFVTNAAMDMPIGFMQLTFRHKIFNGNDYDTEFEDYTGPQIPLTIDIDGL